MSVPGPGGPGGPGGFSPPPYPYERLSTLGSLGAAHEGGLVDLSVGTPSDPPPAAVVGALATSGSERGYPPSVGSLELREAACGWMERRFGIPVRADQVAACVGTKEMVASTAGYLRLRDPTRDTVLCPTPAYPTYAMSALLAGCRAVEVGALPGGGIDLAAIAPSEAGRALMLWVNSPSNPTGALSDLAEAAAWGRHHGVPVFSDECYAEFTWSGTPRSILEHGTDGVVAVHSLSKRSNLAGIRVGFYAGDPGLVGYLSEVRKHAGLMVPGPVQAAGAVALSDDSHVIDQRARYLGRLERLASALGVAGVPVTLPEGGFYLWVPVPPEVSTAAHSTSARSGSAGGESPSWRFARTLASRAGVLVSPGEFYGSAGEGFVRIAAVAPDDRIEMVAGRIAALGQGWMV